MTCADGGNDSRDGMAPPGAGPDRALQRLRAQSEDVDVALADLLARRVALARETAAAKGAVGLPLLDPQREAEVVRRGVALARERGLDPEAVRAILWRVVGMCRDAQEGGGGTDHVPVEARP